MNLVPVIAVAVAPPSAVPAAFVGVPARVAAVAAAPLEVAAHVPATA
eukprot:CAMPEP_0171830566 /NCGR_PEP_ID=MMETSP0992-20121227/8301_1 /TAXON_ID=483369 /ORGANISM="non described non described, Strain CCMP2098" /LENGTH=46 /DNA_ID= /DNA_START= /DNA_END= /DNA_ORIENTATION=